MQYGLPQDLATIKDLSKDSFKRQVKQAVIDSAFKSLSAECKSLKKTADLVYEKFETQNYLKVLFPNQAKVILKSRCKTLDIKSHCTYKYKDDTICRGCGMTDETFSHIINCGKQEALHVNIEDVNDKSELTTINLSRIVGRILSFFDVISDESRTNATPAASPVSVEPSVNGG